MGVIQNSINQTLGSAAIAARLNPKKVYEEKHGKPEQPKEEEIQTSLGPLSKLPASIQQQLRLQLLPNDTQKGEEANKQAKIQQEAKRLQQQRRKEHADIMKKYYMK